MSTSKHDGDPVDPEDVDTYLAETEAPQPASGPNRGNPDDSTDRMALSEDEASEGEIIGDEGSIQQVNLRDWPEGKRNQGVEDPPRADPDQYLTGSEDEISYGAL